MAFAEVVARGIFNVEDTDQFFFGDQRNAEFGAGFVVKFDVARVRAHIGDDDRLASARGGTDQAAIDGNAGFLDYLRTGERKAMDQIFPRGIEEQDRKRLILEKLGEQFADSAQKLIGVEHGAEFAADAVQQMQSFSLGLGGFLGFVQFLFALDALGDVADKCAEETAGVAGNRAADGDFHGEFMAVAMSRIHFHSQVRGLVSAGFAKAVPGGVAMNWRNNLIP